MQCENSDFQLEGDAGGHSSSSGGSHAPAHWCLVQGGVRDDPTADPGPDGGRRVAIQAAWRDLLTNDAPPSSVAARRVADDGLIEGGRLLKGGSCSNSIPQFMVGGQPSARHCVGGRSE